VSVKPSGGFEVIGATNMPDMASQFEGLLQNLGGGKTKKHRMKIKDALKLLRDDEAAKMLNEEEIKAQAIYNVEQHGIVFIDEIDKVTERGGEVRGPSVSRSGVQRDLLPLIEGSAISTKYGMVNTDHILFIASGAFALSKPSDLIPELQGRLPIRVELEPLTVDHYVSILKHREASLTTQYTALLGTENIDLSFTDEAITKLAEATWKVNDKMENIGARRLYTIFERLLNIISFEAPDRSGETVVVDAAFVEANLGELIQDMDLARYIL
jgi:ATP-dependent HslUV protease ATP-binding subunit HslU